MQTRNINIFFYISHSSCHLVTCYHATVCYHIEYKHYFYDYNLIYIGTFGVTQRKGGGLGDLPYMMSS